MLLKYFTGQSFWRWECETIYPQESEITSTFQSTGRAFRFLSPEACAEPCEAVHELGKYACFRWSKSESNSRTLKSWWNYTFLWTYCLTFLPAKGPTTWTTRKVHSNNILFNILACRGRERKRSWFKRSFLPDMQFNVRFPGNHMWLVSTAWIVLCIDNFLVYMHTMSTCIDSSFSYMYSFGLLGLILNGKY